MNLAASRLHDILLHVEVRLVNRGQEFGFVIRNQNQKTFIRYIYNEASVITYTGNVLHMQDIAGLDATKFISET